MSDLRSLLDQIRQGDENAFAILTKEYQGVTENAVKRFAPSFGISDNSAVSDASELYGTDDLRQYATIALYRAAQTYRPDAEGKKVSFGLYAKICINNALISQLRRYRSQKKRREAARTAGHSSGNTADPLQSLIRDEEAGVWKRKVGKILSKYEYQIFEYYIDGKSVGEIAERLGKEEKSVSNALYRVKVKIRGLLIN